MLLKAMISVYVFTYVRSRSTRQKNVNWFDVVTFLQSICYGEACEGTKTKTDQNGVKLTVKIEHEEAVKKKETIRRQTENCDVL